MKIPVAITICALTLAASFATLGAQQPPSVLGGVFTADQAKRGEKVYADSCAACHGASLAGDLGPALAGKDFVAGWKDMTVGDLFDKVSSTMPSNAPGSLMPGQYADIVAFVLNSNKYPAGQKDLPADVAALKAVKMAVPPAP